MGAEMEDAIFKDMMTMQTHQLGCNIQLTISP
jgi:hypothetical protein